MATTPTHKIPTPGGGFIKSRTPRRFIAVGRTAAGTYLVIKRSDSLATARRLYPHFIYDTSHHTVIWTRPGA